MANTKNTNLIGQTTTDVPEKIEAYSADMLRLVEMIEKHVETYASSGKQDWGHVGTMAHGHEQLWNVAGSMGLLGEDWDAEL